MHTTFIFGAGLKFMKKGLPVLIACLLLYKITFGQLSVDNSAQAEELL